MQNFDGIVEYGRAKDCLLCDGQSVKIGDKMGYDMCLCKDCWFIFTDMPQSKKSVMDKFVDYWGKAFSSLEINFQYRTSDEVMDRRINRMLYYNPQGKSWLDVGCGEGTYLKELHKRGFTDAYGIDPALAIPKEWYLGKFMDEINLRKFDFVICVETLEHITDPIKFLTEIKNFIGGYVMITTELIEAHPEEHIYDKGYIFGTPSHY
jgi:SAM-dependent methyltransferase